MKKKVVLLPILMMVLAACGGDPSATGSTPTPPPSTNDSTGGGTSTPAPDTTKTIAEIKTALADLADKAWTDVEYSTEGTVIAFQGSSYFIQDGAAGILVYGAPAIEGLAVGDRVSVEGYIQRYNILEFAPMKVGEGDAAVTNPVKVAKLAETVAVAPLVVTAYNETTLAPEAPRLVKIEGLKVADMSTVEALALTTSGKSDGIKLSLGEVEVTATVNKYLSIDEKTNIKNKLLSMDHANDNFDFQGVLNAYQGKAQLSINAGAEITTHEHEAIATTGVTLAVKDAAEAKVEVGRTLELVGGVLPADADNKALTYETSNPDVLTVSTTGVVTGVSVGTATVTAKQGDLVSDPVSIEVAARQAIATTGITISGDIAMEIGDINEFTFVTAPVDADNQEVVWSSSDTAVATIDQDGKLTALMAGTTIVKATQDAIVSNEITVTVTAAAAQTELLSQAFGPGGSLPTGWTGSGNAVFATDFLALKAAGNYLQMADISLPTGAKNVYVKVYSVANNASADKAGSMTVYAVDDGGAASDTNKGAFVPHNGSVSNAAAINNATGEDNVRIVKLDATGLKGIKLELTTRASNVVVREIKILYTL